MISRNKVRQAKEKLKQILALGKVSLSITKFNGEYAIQVGQLKSLSLYQDIPDNIDGVPIIVKTVGRVKKQ